MLCCNDVLYAIPKQHVCAASIDMALFDSQFLDDPASQTRQVWSVYIARLQLDSTQQVQ